MSHTTLYVIQDRATIKKNFWYSNSLYYNNILEKGGSSYSITLLQ